MPKKSAVQQFIDEERAKGSTDKQIRHLLIDAGWEMDVIQYAMEGKTNHKPVEVPIAQPIKRTIPEILVHPYALALILLGLILFVLFCVVTLA